MRRHRYPQPNTRSPEQDQLPLDTVCTIIIRQSTSIQRERNLFNAPIKTLCRVVGWQHGDVPSS
jgi:hypothetical protein